MPVILSKDTLTFEPTVVVRSEKGIVYFRGTEKELIELIQATHNMAESIRLDLDADNMDASNEQIAMKQYQEFSKKYS